MKRSGLLMLFLAACGSQDRFTEQELAAEDIPDDPSAWTVQANLPSMVTIQPGSFTMGSADGTRGRTVDEQQHQVTLSRPFLLAATEVNQGLYRAVTGRNPSMSVGYDRKAMVAEKLPVQGLSFVDAVRFCNRLSELQGLAPAYTVDGAEVAWDASADGYRLPTEAEWEYAAGGGTPGPWAGADSPETACLVANVSDVTLGSAEGFPCDDGHASKAAVGSLAASAWGLHDLTGNVWEWVWDRHGPHPADAVEDPSGADRGSHRVYKGGSWLDGPEASRIAARRHGDPGELSIQLGFRLARSAAGTAQ